MTEWTTRVFVNDCNISFCFFFLINFQVVAYDRNVFTEDGPGARDCAKWYRGQRTQGTVL